MTQTYRSNFWIAKNDVMSGLICDKVAIQMWLQGEGCSESCIKTVTNLIDARIKNIKESTVNVPDTDGESLGL